MDIDRLTDLIGKIEREVDELVPPSRVRKRLKAARKAVRKPESPSRSAAVAGPAQGLYPPIPRRRMLLTAGAAGAVIAINGVQAALRAGADIPIPSPSTLPPEEREEGMLWRVSLGAAGTAIGPADGQTVIAVAASQVFASGSRSGRLLWTQFLTTDTGVSAWRQSERVVVADKRRIWALDAATGDRMFEVDLAALEERTFAHENPEGAVVQVEDVLPAGERLVVRLTTATVVLDSSGQMMWRVGRPFDRQGRRSLPPRPMVADADRVVCRESGTQSQITMRQLNNGVLVWQQPDTFSQQDTDQSPPPPPPGGSRGPFNPAWQRAEGRAAGGMFALRDGSAVQLRRLTDGKLMWHFTSVTPIAAMEVAGGLVITAGDRLVARRFDDREVAWEVLMRGARLAMPPSRAWIAATDGIELVTLDFEGKPRKRIARPVSVGEGEVLELVVDESTAYVVFGKRDIAAELVALDLVP